MPGIARSHHILGVEHLLSEFRYGERSVLLATARRKGREAGHEEMKTGEGHHVYGEFSKIGVQLTGEPQTSRDARHREGNEMVQIAVCGRRQFQSAETDIVKGLVINTVSFVGILNKLVHGKSCVVRLDNCIGYLGRRHDGIRIHDSIWILLADLGNEQGTHTGASTTAQGMRKLESLQTIATLSFFSYDVENRVDQFSAFGVMTLCPVVARTALTEHEVVGSKDLTEWSRAYRVHGARFQVDEDGTGHVFAARCLIVVYVDSFQLEVGVTMIGASRVNAMLVADNFPKLQCKKVLSLRIKVNIFINIALYYPVTPCDI